MHFDTHTSGGNLVIVTKAFGNALHYLFPTKENAFKRIRKINKGERIGLLDTLRLLRFVWLAKRLGNAQEMCARNRCNSEACSHATALLEKKFYPDSAEPGRLDVLLIRIAAWSLHALALLLQIKPALMIFGVLGKREVFMADLMQIANNALAAGPVRFVAEMALRILAGANQGLTAASALADLALSSIALYAAFKLQEVASLTRKNVEMAGLHESVRSLKEMNGSAHMAARLFAPVGIAAVAALILFPAYSAHVAAGAAVLGFAQMINATRKGSSGLFWQGSAGIWQI